MARKEWNHEPESLPLTVNPLFTWPLDPKKILAWYWGSWFPISVNLVLVALSYGIVIWTLPPLTEMASPGLWMVAIVLRNLVIAALIAETLHTLFHRTSLQGGDKKYDPRPFPRKGRVFTFGDQYLDNMFWALASGVPIWSLFEILVLWAMATGWAPVWTWSDGWVWYLAVFFLIPSWQSFYFFWIHRLLHTNLLYRYHALHHRNTDVGPWSGLSMHPFEHVLYFGTALIHFVVPSSPVHLICHLLFFAVYPILTHTGFDGIWIAGRRRLKLGAFHHQLHHRFFEVNYGTLEVPWDKVFGTLHDGSEDGKAMMKERLKTCSRSVQNDKAS